MGARAEQLPLSQILASGQRSFSFEFFPPADEEGEARLWQALRALEAIRPTFVSVTYGAGGSTRDRTVRITREIATHTQLPSVAHLTCVGSTVDEIRYIAGTYMAAGITNVLALRGDPQGGPTAQWSSTPGGLDHADQLVELLHTLGDFSIGVAAFPDGHPATGGDRQRDIDVLARKADLGASFAVTQFFFEVEKWMRLVDDLAERDCYLPIIPGIMPVTNVKQIKRFAELSGAALPPDVIARFERVADRPSDVRALGVELATHMCSELLDAGAPGLHFYTLNASTATQEIYRNLVGASDSIAR
jgi:methylenetetrahydrofolate reductase (NADPH)